MNRFNFITIGSCLAYLIANRCKEFGYGNFVSSTRHNRIDKIVDVYLDRSKDELPYSYLKNFKYDDNSHLNLGQQIDNQFSDRNLGKTSLKVERAIGLTEIFANPANVDCILYDTFNDILSKLLYSKDCDLPFFFNVKYSSNWNDYFYLEEDRLAIEDIICNYIKLVEYFYSNNPNIKIIFINFPLFHHPKTYVRDRSSKLNEAFMQNAFLREKSFFIPAFPVEKRFISKKDRNRFKLHNNRSIYKQYAKVVNAIANNNFDSDSEIWSKVIGDGKSTLYSKLSEIIDTCGVQLNNKYESEMKNISTSTIGRETVQVYLDKANKLLEEKKTHEAIKRYQNLLEIAYDNFELPDLIQIHKDIDKVLTRQNAYSELIAIYEQTTEIYPENHWFIKRLGDTYRNKNKFCVAVECYKRAIKLDPSFSWSHKGLGDAYNAQAFRYLDKAYDSYQQAIMLNSNMNKNLSDKVEKLSEIIKPINKESFQPSDRNNYWQKRKDSLLYQMLKSLAFAYVPNGKSILEVGCHTSSFILELDWFTEKVVTDFPYLAQHWKGVEGVKFIPGNFYKTEFERTFDLVLCTQVVEHLQEPKPFIQKLLSLGKTIIVSTTYEVPEELCKYHVQDPISLEKFQSWFEREFTATVIIEKPEQKVWKNIVAVVKQ